MDSVKQQGLYRRSGNPWPPFRIPSLPHGAYLGLNKLLHCRTMHAVLFTLLYKVCADHWRGSFCLLSVYHAHQPWWIIHFCGSFYYAFNRGMVNSWRT